MEPNGLEVDAPKAKRNWRHFFVGDLDYGVLCTVRRRHFCPFRHGRQVVHAADAHGHLRRIVHWSQPQWPYCRGNKGARMAPHFFGERSAEHRGPTCDHGTRDARHSSARHSDDAHAARLIGADAQMRARQCVTRPSLRPQVRTPTPALSRAGWSFLRAGVNDWLGLVTAFVVGAQHALVCAERALAVDLRRAAMATDGSHETLLCSCTKNPRAGHGGRSHCAAPARRPLRHAQRVVLPAREWTGRRTDRASQRTTVHKPTSEFMRLLALVD